MSVYSADAQRNHGASAASFGRHWRRTGGSERRVPRAAWLLALTVLYGIAAHGQTRVFGFDFSPFVNGQGPGSFVTPEQIRARLTLIAPYTVWVRTYSSLNGLDQVCPIAHQIGLKCAAGASIYGSSVDSQELASLENLAVSGYVDLAVIGTEAVYRQNVLPQGLADMIAQFRAAAPGVPVTTADTYQSYLDNPILFSAVDLVYLNVYPYFESISLQNSPGWVNAWYQIVAAAAGPKPVWISETGWPGSPNSDAASYFFSLESWAKTKSINLFYFEALNEIWKGGIEATFGVFTQYGVMKPGMAPVFNGNPPVDTWSGNISGGAGNPAIAFTYVPPVGVQDAIRGAVLHARPADYKVVCYISVGQWYVKPYASRPYTPILATDGTWSCSAPSDTGETQIAALLFANGKAATGNFNQDLANSAASVITPRTSIAIYGVVLDQNGNGIDGATVTLSGNTSQTAITTGGGKYSFVNLPAGNYSVSASVAGTSITPSSLSFQNLSNVQNGNFTAVGYPFSVSGSITDNTSHALSGANVSLGSPYVAQTAADPFGYYKLPGIIPGSSITVIPTAAGYEFNPPSLSFAAVSSGFTANFVGHPVLALTVSHFGAFAAGQASATYSIAVRNSSVSTNTNGLVTVSETVPVGLTLESMIGTGWSCNGTTCTRSDTLAPGSSYPPLVAAVSVAADSPATVVNRVDLSGAGSAASTVLDSTVISPYPVSLTASPNPSRLGQAVTLSLTLPVTATGHVAFYAGATVLGTLKVTGGKATLNTNSVPFGSTSVVARYSGDSTFAALTTVPMIHQVTSVGVAGLGLASTSSVGARPGSPAVADLNGDGRTDVIVPSWDYDYVSVLLGNGDGTFQPASNYTVGSAPVSVAVADFNSDGIPDCAVANRNSGNLTILLGNGDGTFRAQGNIGSLSLPFYIDTADFNNDGYPDIAVASGNSGVSNIEVFLGNGDGTFQSQSDVSTARIDGSNYSFGFAIADFDGDGNADIVDVNLQNGFTVLPGTGTGGFIKWGAYTWGSGGVASPVLVGDFNGDGVPDLFTGKGTVYPGNGDATFTEGQNYGRQYGYAVADFNGDGNADVMTGSGVMFGAGDGTFAAPVSLGASGVVAEFNGDGRPDVLTFTDSSALVYLGQAAQTITFGALSNVTFGSGAVAMTATATSGLAVEFTSTTTDVCTVNGATLTLVSAGTCSITASQTGTPNYAAATPVTQSFVITQAGQTISFAALSNVTFGLETVALTATANSGLSVTFTSATTDVCTVRDVTVTLVSAGTCSITANQAGNGSYGAAAPVTRSFTISAATCDINSDGTTNVADVQLIINEALGAVPAVHDLNGDGLVNVADVQKVINTALGLGCAVQ